MQKASALVEADSYQDIPSSLQAKLGAGEPQEQTPGTYESEWH
jgi:hypothetical protein